MARFRYRVIDDAGSELGIVELDEPVGEGDAIPILDFGPQQILEVYDDEAGRDGGVDATVVIEEL